jgi:hypothetical protein
VLRAAPLVLAFLPAFDLCFCVCLVHARLHCPVPWQVACRPVPVHYDDFLRVAYGSSDTLAPATIHALDRNPRHPCLFLLGLFTRERLMGCLNIDRWYDSCCATLRPSGVQIHCKPHSETSGTSNAACFTQCFFTAQMAASGTQIRRVEVKDFALILTANMTGNCPMSHKDVPPQCD